MAPQNNYTSNIKDPWSKVTMTSVINERVWNIRRIARMWNGHKMSKCCWKMVSIDTCSMQGCHIHFVRSETMWGMPVHTWWKDSRNQVGDVFDVAIWARHMMYETVGPLFLPRFTWCRELSDFELMGYVGNMANYRLDVCGICGGNGGWAVLYTYIHTSNIRCNLNGLM